MAVKAVKEQAIFTKKGCSRLPRGSLQESSGNEAF